MLVVSIGSATNVSEEQRALSELHFYYQKLWPTHAAKTPINTQTRIQPQALRALNFKTEFFKAMAEIIPFGTDISDKTIFKRTLSAMGLKVPSEVWNEISDDDVIEIYNGDFLQTAHNFSFMNYCSYHPQDLCSYEWWELFERDLSITQALAEIGNQIFRGKVKGFARIPTPKHIVRELLSPTPYTLEVQQGIMGPVYDSGVIIAGITTLRAKHLTND